MSSIPNLDFIWEHIDKNDERKYYDYRRLLHDIYDRDICYGDLAAPILEFRDRNRFIDTISIDVKNYRIYIETTEEITQELTENIIGYINKVITFQYLDEVINSRLLPQSAIDLINQFRGTGWVTFDFIITGDHQIEINL